MVYESYYTYKLVGEATRTVPHEDVVSALIVDGCLGSSTYKYRTIDHLPLSFPAYSFPLQLGGANDQRQYTQRQESA